MILVACAVATPRGNSSYVDIGNVKRANSCMFLIKRESVSPWRTNHLQTHSPFRNLSMFVESQHAHIK